MTRIINCNVPGDCTLHGHAGPVGGERGSKWNFCKWVKLKPAQFCALSLSILFTGRGSLGNGRFDGWRDIVSALPLGILTSYSPATGSVTTVTKTKNVTMSFPTFSSALSSNSVTEITLILFLFRTGNWGVSNASDITFTITDNKGNGNDAFSEGKVKLADVKTFIVRIIGHGILLYFPCARFKTTA